jgi:hypothetical protein
MDQYNYHMSINLILKFDCGCFFLWFLYLFFDCHIILKINVIDLLISDSIVYFTFYVKIIVDHYYGFLIFISPNGFLIFISPKDIMFVFRFFFDNYYLNHIIIMFILYLNLPVFMKIYYILFLVSSYFLHKYYFYYFEVILIKIDIH